MKVSSVHCTEAALNDSYINAMNIYFNKAFQKAGRGLDHPEEGIVLSASDHLCQRFIGRFA